MVFKSKALSIIFLRVISFLGWLHPDMFFASHLRHHRFTGNYPLDQEIVLPIELSMRQFLSFSIVNFQGFCEILQQTLYAAMNRFPTGHLGWSPEWEAIVYPENQLDVRAPAVRWARQMLFGHVLIAVVSLVRGLWLVPVIFSLGPFYGGGLFFLCNSTQHVGLQSGQADFRRNCRTFYLNPVVRFLYWQMNYHMEHHMYASVPCYNLQRLHEAIRHDVPTPPNGLLAAWKEIIAIVAKQKAEPTWEVDVALPSSTCAAGVSVVDSACASSASPQLRGRILPRS